MGERAERPRPVAASPHPRLRGEPEAAADRCHRPLPGAPMGRQDAARGDAGGARHARASGQGPLCRLLQLFRLAHHEGARRSAERDRLPALRQPADPLHARGARGRIRAGADLDRPGARHPGLEPARRRAAVAASTAATRPRPKARASSPAGPSRRSATRSGSGGSSTCWSRSAKRAAFRPRRWRWPGCSAGPAVTSVIIGGRTEAQFRDNLAAAELKLTARGARSGSTPSARRRSSTPTGTSCAPRATGLGAADLSLLGPSLKQ